MSARQWPLLHYRRVALLGAMGLGVSLYIALLGNAPFSGLTLAGLIGLLLWSLARQTREQTALREQLATLEGHLRQAFETHPTPQLIVDPKDGRIVAANDATVRFYGHDRPALLGMRINDLDAQPKADTSTILALATDAREGRVVTRHRAAGGGIRDVEVASGHLDTEQGNLLHLIVHDVTDYKLAEEALRESETRFRQLADNVDAVFWVNSPDWRQVYYISPAYQRIWGRNPGALFTDGMDWFEAVLAEDQAALHAKLPAPTAVDWQTIEFPPYRIRRPDGGIRWIAARAFAIHDEQGRLTRVAGIAEDITDRQTQQLRLEELAHHDVLTKLPNRLLLADRMAQALARGRRTGQLLATCMLDLDGFKAVNDRFGHAAGDQLLVQVGQRLLEGVRGDDTVARLGGDEFVLLLCGMGNLKEVEETLRRLLELVAVPYVIADQQVTVSASIGVTIFPNDTGDADTLLRHADHAMYLAKQSGKNRFHLFNPVLEHRERENHQALELITRALDRDELRLHFQPIVDSRLGKVIAMESLLRWQHPVLGLLSPAEFLPLVDSDPALVKRMGTWVLREALGQLREWQRAGLDVSVSVNVFARQLRDPDFPRLLEDLLTEFADVPARRLTLEILESAALEDMGSVIRLIKFSERHGIRYALDDFGTGYSSLTYLRRLPVHSLKIDQSFVRDMLQDPEDMSIVEGIIGLATAFRHRVVAEGVESTDHALMLQEMGCHLVQGHGIAQPMSAAETLRWLRDFRPDPRWLVNASKRLAHDDHQLVLAEVHHRQWLAQLLAWGHAEATRRGTPPPQDIHACNFGRWYHGEGAKRYGHLAPFAATGPIHERIHQVAAAYIRGIEAGHPEAAEAHETALINERNRLLDSLGHLRAAVRHEDAGQ